MSSGGRKRLGENCVLCGSELRFLLLRRGQEEREGLLPATTSSVELGRALCSFQISSLESVHLGDFSIQGS